MCLVHRPMQPLVLGTAVRGCPAAPAQLERCRRCWLGGAAGACRSSPVRRGQLTRLSAEQALGQRARRGAELRAPGLLGVRARGELGHGQQHLGGHALGVGVRGAVGHT
jgi:hypothetical protein